VGFLPLRNLLQTGFACRDSGLRLARLTGARKSGLHRIDRDSQRTQGVLDIALWAPWESAAVVAIFSLGMKTLRPKWRSVNTKPGSKYFVKVQPQNP